MDVNGYNYGRSWTCSSEQSLFSLSSAHFRIHEYRFLKSAYGVTGELDII
jgi:hypothetical protein